MKNLKFLPLLLPLIFLNAQGLDESYLESLPEDEKTYWKDQKKKVKVRKKTTDHLFTRVNLGKLKNCLS